MTVRLFLRKQHDPPPVANAQQPDPSYRRVEVKGFRQMGTVENLLNDGWRVIGAEVVKDE